MWHKPYSSLSTEGDLTPTPANFPSLRSFFQFKETSGNMFTDGVSGAWFSLDNPVFNASGFSVSGSALNLSGSRAGLPSFATGDNIVLMVVGAVTSASVVAGATFGDGANATNDSAGIFRAGSNMSVYCGDTATFPTVVTVPIDSSLHSFVGYGTVGQKNWTVLWENGGKGVDASTTIPAMDFASSGSGYPFHFKDCMVASMALMKPSVLPDEASLRAALEWSLYHHSRGNKVLHPGLRSL